MLILEHWPRLIAMAGLLVISAIFSGAETAFFSLSRHEVRRLREEASVMDAFLLRLIGSPRRLLTTVLFGNLLVNVAYFSIAADLSVRAAAAGLRPLAVGTSAFAVLFLIFLGEFLPKGTALRHSVGYARLTAAPVFFFDKAIFPVRFALEAIVSLLSGPLGGRSASSPHVTADELKAFVRLSGAAGRIGAGERDMLEDVIDLGEMRLREVAIPRVDMVAADVTADREGVLALAREKRVSKVVVYEQSRDNVVGFVAVKDLLYRPRARLTELIREIPAFPETKTVESLLREFRTNHAPLALIVDEYGGTQGIVTPEDLVEVVVGEIGDEYDPAVGPIRSVGPGHLLVAGEATLREWEERTGIALPAGKYETVAGYVLSALGRVPVPGDSVRGPEHRFTVVRVRSGRVLSVVAERAGSR